MMGAKAKMHFVFARCQFFGGDKYSPHRPSDVKKTNKNGYYLSKKKLPHPTNSICLLMHVAFKLIELENPVGQVFFV